MNHPTKTRVMVEVRSYSRCTSAAVILCLDLNVYRARAHVLRGRRVALRSIADLRAGAQAGR